MTFKFGPKSIEHMTGVYPALIHAAHFALQNSDVDFGFFEGVRTKEKEIENIKNGTSKLNNPELCTHCVQKDGFGHAMDLVPWLPREESYQVEVKEMVSDGEDKEPKEITKIETKKRIIYSSTWDMSACIKIAKLIQQYSIENNLTIRWGGVWDMSLNKLSSDLEKEITAYQVRHKGKDFFDGVHFEIPVESNAPNDEVNPAIVA